MPERCLSESTIIAAGSTIPGTMWIGDHACIGANVVALTHAPPGKTAVRVPTMIINMRNACTIVVAVLLAD